VQCWDRLSCPAVSATKMIPRSAKPHSLRHTGVAQWTGVEAIPRYDTAWQALPVVDSSLVT
jgi:hypothetical protein